jgi:hypothetical protein
VIIEDSDATVDTLSLNEEEKYKKSFGEGQKLDGQLLDDAAAGTMCSPSMIRPSDWRPAM